MLFLVGAELLFFIFFVVGFSLFAFRHEISNPFTNDRLGWNWSVNNLTGDTSKIYEKMRESSTGKRQT